jgi:hypothetical protein
MDRLAQSVKNALFDDQHQTYGAVVIDYPVEEDSANLVIFSRIVDQKIVVEADYTDRPFVEALLEQSISRDEIILAYSGESSPTP